MARGKARGPRRGGGHSFSRDLVLDEDGVAVSTGKDKRFVKPVDEENGDEIEEESDDDDDALGASTPSTSAAPGEMLSRAERKAMKQAAKKKNQDEEEDEDADLVNLNRSLQMDPRSPDLSAPKELSRREREAKEKKEAAEKYRKLHAAGKTVEAKSDLARLTLIRKEREAAAAKRKAEQEAKQAELEAKQTASKQKH